MVDQEPERAWERMLQWLVRRISCHLPMSFRSVAVVLLGKRRKNKRTALFRVEHVPPLRQVPFLDLSCWCSAGNEGMPTINHPTGGFLSGNPQVYIYFPHSPPISRSQAASLLQAPVTGNRFLRPAAAPGPPPLLQCRRSTKGAAPDAENRRSPH